MKNIRKIVAILAAVLMLCTVMPISAIVSADINMNFENGTNGWASDCGVEVVELDGSNVLKWNANLDWANMYNYCNLSANTEYVMTMKVKADRDTNMNFKVLSGDWTSVPFETTFGVSTEWQEISVQFNTGANGNFVMLSTNTKGVDGATYYVDDFSIVEYVEPVEPGTNLFVNGDFETGDTNGWNKHQQTTVTADAAKDGSYGAYLNGNSASWGGVLDQNVTVVAGKTYVFSFDYKAVRQGFNFTLTGVQSGTKYAGDYVSATSWTYFEKEITIVGDTELKLNFNCGGQTGTDEMYLDNISLKEVQTASFDGYITNGDFEVGDTTGWTNLYGSTAIEMVEGRNGGYALKGTASGNYNIVYQEVAVEPNTDYTVMAYTKNANNSNLWIKNAGGNGDITNKSFATDEWALTSVTFNSGANTTVWVGLMGLSAGSTYVVDDIFMFEAKPESNDGYIKNGDFETGSLNSWSLIWGSQIAASIVNDGHNSTFGVQVTGKSSWGQLRQKIDVKPNTNYRITLWAKDVKGMSLLVKDSADNGNIVNPGINAGEEWTEVSVEFNSGDNTFVYAGVMVADASSYGTFDDFKVVEVIDPSFDGYIKNGDFETGSIAPWINLWDSNDVSFVEGHESNYAMKMVVPAEKVWCQVRQDGIAVEPNTTYRLTAYVKGAQNMAFVIKTGDDTYDMTSHNDCIFPAGNEWQKVTLEFDTGITVSAKNETIPYAIDSICILVINYEAGAEVIIDDITLEKVVCEHEYDDCDDADCNLCGETREPGHILTYYAAVEATNCQVTGHDEYWYCENCGCYFGDAEASWQHNPGWLFSTGECVRPEGAADCATVPCELCGNDVYGYGEHDVFACQGGTCSKCGETVEGYGCANYDTPACEDGVCYYCGGFVAGFGHENGAWAACCDGECAYGCGLQYPASESHADEDGDDYCDNCWSHLACADEDGDGWCDVCWREMPSEPVVDVLYGDVDGDGEIAAMDAVLLGQYLAKWDVEGLNFANADVDGDGEIAAMDAVLLGQYLAKWDVVLGPQGPV